MTGDITFAGCHPYAGWRCAPPHFCKKLRRLLLFPPLSIVPDFFIASAVAVLCPRFCIAPPVTVLRPRFFIAPAVSHCPRFRTSRAIAAFSPDSAFLRRRRSALYISHFPNCHRSVLSIFHCSLRRRSALLSPQCTTATAADRAVAVVHCCRRRHKVQLLLFVICSNQ